MLYKVVYKFIDMVSKTDLHVYMYFVLWLHQMDQEAKLPMNEHFTWMYKFNIVVVMLEMAVKFYYFYY